MKWEEMETNRDYLELDRGPRQAPPGRNPPVKKTTEKVRHLWTLHGH